MAIFRRTQERKRGMLKARWRMRKLKRMRRRRRRRGHDGALGAKTREPGMAARGGSGGRRRRLSPRYMLLGWYSEPAAGAGAEGAEAGVGREAVDLGARARTESSRLGSGARSCSVRARSPIRCGYFLGIPASSSHHLRSLPLTLEPLPHFQPLPPALPFASTSQPRDSLSLACLSVSTIPSL